MYKSSFEVFKHKNIDFSYYFIYTLSVGLPCPIIKKIKGIPFVLKLEICGPRELPIQMGVKIL